MTKRNGAPILKPVSEHITSIAGKEREGSVTTRNRLLFILAFVTLLAYCNTFNNEYALDDISVITKNTIVSRGVSAIPEILSTPYRWGFFVTSNDLYRPLSQVMFAAEYQVFGGAAAPMHVINVLLFAACVLLLFIFMDRLFDGKRTAAAFIASLLFALHPIHTEVVANIKGRDDVLCFLFAFLSINIFLSYSNRGKLSQLLAGFGCFFLSLLSKETAITFLAIIPLIFFFYKNENKRRSIYISCAAATAAVIFLIIRFSVLHAYHADHIGDLKFMDNALSGAPSKASAIATAIFILGKYLKLLVVPYPLICDYSYSSIPFVSFGNMWVLLSLAAYIFIGGFSIYRLMKNKKDTIAFGLLFFLITLALFSNIIFLTGATMAERFLFFPSAGFCWIAGLTIVELTAKLPNSLVDVLLNKKLLAVVLPVSILYIGVTICRNNDWHDNLTLYSADAERSHDNARLQYYLGNELVLSGAEQDGATRQQLMLEAIGHLKKALDVYPAYDDAQRVLGNGYFFIGQNDSAIAHLTQAITVNTKDISAMNNLNVVYFNTHKYIEAIGICKLLLQNDPHYSEGYNDMAVCYLYLKNYDSSIYTLRKGVTIDPGYNAFYENLALAYKMRGNIDSAKKYEVIAQQQHPDFRVL